MFEEAEGDASVQAIIFFTAKSITISLSSAPMHTLSEASSVLFLLNFAALLSSTMYASIVICK